MSFVNRCSHCFKLLRADFRPDEKNTEDLGHKKDCPFCDLERKKLSLNQVVQSRVPAVYEVDSDVDIG